MTVNPQWLNGETFLMLGTELCEEVGTNTNIRPLYLRLIFLGFARVNAIGHAEFESGELARALGDVDEYGQVVRAKRSTVNSALRKAIETGVIFPGSGERCLILHPDVRRGKAEAKCGWHRINTDQRRKRSTLLPHAA